MSTKRVLIVEDDAHIADLLRMHLGDEGYDVAHAASGDAGLRLLEQDGPWDALVLDVMLPGVDGLQVCQRARAMARYVPIIIISARGSETQRIVGLELGAAQQRAHRCRRDRAGWAATRSGRAHRVGGWQYVGADAARI